VQPLTKRPASTVESASGQSDESTRAPASTGSRALARGTRSPGRADYSGSPVARKPLCPLQESPGWNPDALRSAGVAPAALSARWTWPQFCGGAPPGPGNPAPSPSSRPEKTQMEFAWAGPWVGLPPPAISPAGAGVASAIAATTPAAGDQGGTETHGRPFRRRYWIRQVSESNTKVQKNAQ